MSGPAHDAAALPADHDGGASSRSTVARVLLARWIDPLLASYSQILFNRSRLVGLLLLGATLSSPRVAAAGLAAVLLATLVARVLGLSSDLTRAGLFGYNALLVGLGAAHLFEPGTGALALVIVAVAASVLVTAAIHSAMGSTFNLPALTLPFLVVFYLLLAAAPALGVAFAPLSADPLAARVALPDPLATFLQSLGAIFFLPRIDAGAVVLLALVVYSRIGVLLAVVGFAVAQLLGIHLVEMPLALLPVVLGYNFILTAVALGGVWFVPGLSSFVLAIAGVLICGLVTIGLLPFLTWNGIPPLILPFNLTLILLLYAMRQRVRDGQPKAVDFLLGTPEENLNYYRTRLSRFGSHYVLRFGAPFLGRWTCTQGVDGQQTHRGPWRHGLDFEVAGQDGQLFRGQGRSLSDYRCYRLPVLAAADGTVAKVVDSVLDNPVGEINLKDNWGNLVLIYHAPGLCSLVAHLSPGTVKVREGQFVRRGETLGLCGNSGRSPVPHLHFQLQATARIGAPTLHVELHDVISEVISGDGERAVLHRTLVPAQGQVVRSLQPQADLEQLVRLPYGEPLTFEVERTADSSGRRERERLLPEIDLLGNLLLRSDSRRSTLFYDRQPTHFTVFDTLGPRSSVLHLLHAALSRLPFEVGPQLVWDDVLPRRRFLPAWLGVLYDLLSPFVGAGGIEIEYTARRDGSNLLVQGRSRRLARGGQPLVRTEAVLDEHGIERASLTVRGATRAARRVRLEQPTASDHRSQPSQPSQRSDVP